MAETPDICVLLGKRLRTLRKESELTQEAMAEKAGINLRYYAEVERGKRNISVGTLEKIAKALDVDMADLFRFKPDRQLSEDEERIISLVTRVMADNSKKRKRQVANILAEIMG